MKEEDRKPMKTVQGLVHSKTKALLYEVGNAFNMFVRPFKMHTAFFNNVKCE